ncbi:MAG TPA: glutamyl-tRNA reductase [Acidimicrobiales bacterium]|nr:glutamyl-tRNA reductase [Acidimicrobiales bacterium]
MIVVGVNHRTVPLELLERLAVTADRLPKALHDLVSRDDIAEAVLLSTCNRTEIYVQAEKFHGAVADVRNFLCELAFLAPEELSDHLYTFHDAAAVAHLFSVAAGLDSAVLGESEILGQVRSAWEVAAAEGAAGSAMHLLFRHAVEVGKRVRTETGIGRSSVSVSSAAVALASERLGGLEGRRVLVLGAGEMGEGMLVSLVDAGVRDVRVANRTPERASALADRVGGRAIPMSELGAALAEVDVLLTSTGASDHLVDAASLEARPSQRELLIVDVAVPRDVDPSAGELPGVTLLDMDDLRAFADVGLAERRREIGKVRDLIDEEVARFRDVATGREVAPLVAALRARVEELRVAELERASKGMSDADRAALDAATRSLVAKLLHEPTVRLKDEAGTARGERLAEAIRELFLN